MRKVSVFSGGKLHKPVMFGCLPMDPPRPLCGLVRMGEEPQWSAMPPSCEACDRAEEHLARQKEIHAKGQIEMDI